MDDATSAQHGRVLQVNGPLVTARLPGAPNGEQVRLGALRLTGEIIAREAERAVIQVYENTDSLRPGDPVTRAQMATFLWRYDERPEPASLDTSFTDVPAGRFYSKAVAWLAEQGITTGTTPTTFSPDDPVSRGQMATFLWRYSGSPEPASLNTSFTDVPAGRFYSKAVAWLVEQGITTGTTPATFSPDDPVSRGQMATFLWRLAGEPAV
jgi:predicted enzyme related to lactoylglutathione lyase